MYRAVYYVGGLHPGEIIPEGMLTAQRAEQLMKAGAIEKIAPVFSANAMDEGNATASAPAAHLPIEGEGKGHDGNAEMTDKAVAEAAADEAEAEAAAEEEADAPEIDLMDGIVAEAEPEKKSGRGGRSK